ncbi:MAG: N-acetylmuramic acid 6-phosphate etherase [Flavobacteriales bacterium]
MKKTTEASSKFNHLEKMNTLNILQGINQEDKTVAQCVELVIPQIQKFIDFIEPKIKSGGRLFYIGAGTSGRLGIIDASECPPTFGVSENVVIGIMAGGDSAIRKAVEFAEDDTKQAWKDLKAFEINNNDVVIGIAASGTTPYVVGGLKMCQQEGITTACICCNTDSPVSKNSDFPIEVVVGPEFITGSTRMKSGTAQKLVLNMISTTLMIKLGKVKGNRMVDMQLTNNKLLDRGAKMIAEVTGLDYDTSKQLLLQYGSVRTTIENYKNE